MAQIGTEKRGTDRISQLADGELVHRALRYALRCRRKGDPGWAGVMEVFALGSTSAAQLCRRYGYDPETTYKGIPLATEQHAEPPAARGGEG